jgi:hypothetical protein
VPSKVPQITINKPIVTNHRQGQGIPKNSEKRQSSKLGAQDQAKAF